MAVTLIARKDRRSRARLRTPKCPYCRTSEHVVAVLRSNWFIHFKCMDCGEMRTETKPVAALETSKREAIGR